MYKLSFAGSIDDGIQPAIKSNPEAVKAPPRSDLDFKNVSLVGTSQVPPDQLEGADEATGRSDAAYNQAPR